MNERKYWIEKGYSDEQVTEILNSVHELSKGIQKELSDVKAENVTYANDNATMKARLEEIDKANMTEQQRIDNIKKEAEKNLAESRKILNSAKARQILSGAGLSDEELDNTVNAVVREDEKSTVDNANMFLNMINNLRDTTMKKAKEELSNLNVKPNTNNKNGDDTMTKDKFNKLSYTEQKKFKDENPEEYRNIMNN